VQVLMKTVPSVTQPQAVSIMMEAHNNGMALVITCAQEHAEFYCETLKTHGSARLNLTSRGILL